MRTYLFAIMGALMVSAVIPADSIAQPSPGGRGPGMMGGAGPMFGNTAAYLDGLKTRLKITPDQGAAWDADAATVKASAEQMQAMHQTMFEAMATASWTERRDMMNGMFSARQQVRDSVHDTAEALATKLTPTQRAEAGGILPGLMGPMAPGGMMRGR